MFASIALCFFNLAFAYYKEKLPMSFDMNTMNEYPTDWETAGTAVPLKSKVKILPSLQNTSGRIFASEKLDTLQWEATFKMKVQTMQSESLQAGRWDDIFALWYMINKPIEQKTRKNEAFGYRLQFSGVAIVVYRDTEGYKL